MAGLVAGALLAVYRQKSARHPETPPSHLLPYIAAILAASYPVLFIILSFIPLDHVRMLWENVQIIYLALFILLCAIPFYLYGFFISLALTAWREKTNVVYASDLAGGAAGLLVVVLLMNSLKIEFVMIVLTVAISSVIVCFLKKSCAKIVFGLIVLVACLFVGLGASPLSISPYKGLVQALKDDDARHMATIYSSHSRLDLFENPRMKFAPGLSLAFTGNVPKGIGMALDGEIVGVVMDGRHSTSHDFLAYLPSALPYLLFEPKDVVIIGARNGIDQVQARYFGVQHVHVSEHDASVLKALHVFRRDPSVRSVPVLKGSGRNLLKTLHQKPELIFLSKTGFFPSGNFGLQEDYDLTVEAVETYLRSLQDGGHLFIQMFLLPPPRLELRLVRNIDRALKNIGIDETQGHLLIYRSWDTMNVLIKKIGFSDNDLNKAQHFFATRQFDLIYPDISGQTKFITGLDYGGLILQALRLKEPFDFSSSYVFDIRDTTDDRPFFYYFLKLCRVNEVFELSGRKWAYFLHEGMFLPFCFVFLVFLALALFLVTFLVSGTTVKQCKIQNSRFKISYLLFFALIGFAFMFAEIFFIHRLILYFGSPVQAFSVTIVVILLSAGAGSLASRWIVRRKSVWFLGLAPLFILICSVVFGMIDETPLSVFLIIPIGIVLGLFFPAGIKFLTGEEKDTVAIAYAANGGASVIAPSLASLLAIAYGCTILLILSAIFYAVATAIILTAHRVSKFTQSSHTL
jgi:hypothetical protein